jgi:hypothetical protein
MRPEPPNPLDRALKVLIRRTLPSLLRLAGVTVDPSQIRPDDTAINLPEYRADNVFRIGAEEDPARWALHLEHQLQPDHRVLPDWYYKNAALNRQLERPVILMAVYFARGDRATFPAAYTLQGGSLTNRYEFETVRLWEHADRIRSGELPELAPLLVLCEDSPREATLRQERDMLLPLEVDRPIRSGLLAVAVMVGMRFFARGLVEPVFQEEMQMLKETSFIEEWLEERGDQSEAQAARRFLLQLLRERFGELPAAAVERVEQADAAACEEWGLRLLRATSLEELGLLENGTGAS